MTGPRVLLMHVTTSSGHHQAARAIEQALRRLEPSCEISNIDAFDYTSRFVRFAINHAYLQLIRHHPDVWEYLYDNPAIHRRVQHIRRLLHRYHTRKLARLLDAVRPDVIACTQAFPCGMLADFKQQRGLDVPLVGVLTDYAPHLYWLHETVDLYIVPSDDVKQRFVSYGIQPDRIQSYGIPVEPRFLDPVDRHEVYRRFSLNPELPVALVMGGGSGFGPLREVMLSLDRIIPPCQFVVLAGTNQPLLDWFSRQAFRHTVRAIGYVDCVPELMAVASLMITKPGGLTTAEALAKQVPMVVISPIPGQEVCNARYLLSQGAAVQLTALEHAGDVVAGLLREPGRLERIRAHAARLSHPESALHAARRLLELAARPAVAVAR